MGSSETLHLRCLSCIFAQHFIGWWDLAQKEPTHPLIFLNQDKRVKRQTVILMRCNGQAAADHRSTRWHVWRIRHAAVQRKREGERGEGGGGWRGCALSVQGLQSGHNAGTRDAAINSPLKICHCVISHHVCCKLWPH